MLKYKLENLDGLTDEQKAMYQEKDGAFYLQVEGLPQGEDVSGLKAKVDALLNEKKAEQDARKEEERKRRDAEEEKARKEGDFESLSKSYEEKIEDLKSQLKERDEKMDKNEVSRQATLIATDLAGPNSELLMPFVEQRLRMENGELKVTDGKGNLTISTVDQLKEEFRSNEKFGALVIASNASGSGAGGVNNGGGAVTNNPFKKGEHFNLTEQGRISRENPDLAAQLKKQASQ